MREADLVVANTKGRKRPEVDEVLVAPTVVGGQLYNLCGEVDGLQAARGVVSRALDQGTVGVGEFVKQTRALAREEFLKKVIVNKIGKGLGLDEG
jgi:ESCRT-I complex subunit TSG101